MCERLKQAVLKTAVRETVPGVRIPLPPPLTLLAGKHLTVLTAKLTGSFFPTLEHNWSTLRPPTAAALLRRHRASLS